MVLLRSAFTRGAKIQAAGSPKKNGMPGPHVESRRWVRHTAIGRALRVETTRCVSGRQQLWVVPVQLARQL